VRATTERGDPAVVNADLARYLAVTPDDVLRVARTYLRPENCTVVEYLPA
jgi:predicted Zn-dependent peptidase